MTKGVRAQPKFILRWPEELRDRVAKAGEEAGRSMNAEILHRLQTSFEPPEPNISREELQAIIEEVLDASARPRKRTPRRKRT